METIAGHLYDYPKYYDLIFGSDWAAEFKFLKAGFEMYAKRPIKRLFEPACGTGRLMIQFAKAGFEVAGNDLNGKAIDYCNERLVRHGYPATAFVGDMADFTVKKKVDAAFNMINTFRHLPTEKLAEAHLHCVAESLNKGGLYFLGLHLTQSIRRNVRLNRGRPRAGICRSSRTSGRWEPIPRNGSSGSE